MTTSLVTWAESVVICVELPETIAMQALTYYQAINSTVITMSRRGMVAYARHHCTNYPQLLLTLQAHPGGRRRAYRMMKQRTNTMIVQTLTERGVL